MHPRKHQVLIFPLVLQVQTVMSQTVRNTLSWGSNASPPMLDSRACAAAGQSGLMTLYDAMFSQYGVSIAQILVTMSDFQVREHAHAGASTRTHTDTHTHTHTHKHIHAHTHIRKKIFRVQNTH